MTCVGCGVDLLPGFAFCPHCGRKQPASAAEGEADRRPATILFADVSGFTALAESLDPEEVRSFQNALFGTFKRLITRYDGHVAKFMGDAVLAVFGAPVAHEDDPERALTTALDILDESAALNRQWAPRLGRPVVLHIAVHTGPVVAGSLADAAGAGYDVTGDTVNTASRLLGAAAPGTVLVSQATYALTRHRFAFEAAGELALRGKAEPLVVHRLMGALAEPGSARGLAALGLAAPMVGRGAELDRLLGAFDRMQGGRAQIASLVGEAGTGKSRLMADFLARLERDDGRFAHTTVRRASCSSLGEPAYGLFAALFREGYHVEQRDSLDVARRKLAEGLQALGAGSGMAQAIMPVLSYLLGEEEAHPHELDPEQLRRQIALAARMLVERRVEQTPLLIVIEDLHWADAASIALLQDIADYLAQRPLMVLASHRPDIPPPPVREAEQTVIRLAALTPEDTGTLVGSLFGDVADEGLASLREFVAARSGGNPLFVEEIVRSLVSTGVTVRRGDRWVCAGACDTVNIPATLHGLLLSRVDRLPAGARRLLQEAAVLGLTFDETLLRAIASSASDVDSGLSHLLDADLLREASRGHDGVSYSFTHALVHEAVYENLLLARRSALHERAGLALESAAGPTPSRLSDLEALGHHWSLAADKARGVHYLLAAGDRARAVYANDDAVRHYERALRTLADGRIDGQAHAIRERLADLLAVVGRRAEALAHYEEVGRSLATAADRVGMARLQRKVGGLHWEAGDRQRAGLCFAAGLEQLGEDGSPVERAQLFQEIGRLAFRVGDNARAIEWAERALAEAEREDGAAPDVERTRETAAMQAQAYNTLGVALARTGRLDEAVEKIEQSIALAERHDLLQATCRGYTNLGVLYSSRAPQRSIETCLRGLQTAKKVGDLGFQSRLYANLAVAYCALTDRCEAEGMEAAQIAIDLDRKLGLLDHLAVPLIVLGQIHQCQGDHAPARAAYEEALKLAERIGEPQLLFPCYDGLATLSLDAGDTGTAELYLAKAQEICERAGVEPDALLVLPFLC